MNVSNASSWFFHCFSGCISFCCTSPLSLWCYIWITRLFKNKWYGIPECLIAFSSLSITVINNVLLVGRLLRSDKTQVLVKYLASSLCKSHATWEIRKLLTLFKVHFFTNRSPHIFNIDFVFVVYTRLVIKTPILLDRLCQRFFLTDQELWLLYHHEMFAYFPSATHFSLQTLSHFLNINMLSIKFFNVYLKQKIFWKFDPFTQMRCPHGFEVVVFFCKESVFWTDNFLNSYRKK